MSEDEDSGPSCPGVDKGDPYAGVSEFALPGELRELVARILWDLIYPCRRQLENAEKKLQQNRDAAEQNLSKATSEFELASKQVDQEASREQDRISSALYRVTAIYQQAHDILHSGGVDVTSPPFGPPPMNQSETEAAGLPPVFQVSPQRLQELEAQLQRILQSKPIPYWPKESVAQWAIVIMFLCYGIGLLWFPFVLVSRLVRENSLRGKYEHLVLVGQSLRSHLAAVERRLRADRISKITALEGRLLPPAKRAHASAVAAAQSEFEQEVERIRKKFSAVSQTLHEEVSDFWRKSLYAASEWHSPDWENWYPDPSPEFAARLGAFTIGADDLAARLSRVDFNFRLPALIPFDGGRCLLLEATGAAKEAAGKALQSVMLRMLANTPPGKLRFTFIDPVGLGQNVADYMALADHEEALISGKAWTEPRHIEARLAELSDHMETVIQKYLRNDFSTITEYNKKAQDVAEPFRFLVVFDFPVNFSDEAASRLVSIVKNGPRCGVFTLILRDSAKQLPHGFNIGDLESVATKIAPVQGGADVSIISPAQRPADDEACNQESGRLTDIVFKCPNCEQELAVDSSAACSEINCVFCNEVIVIPEPEPVVMRPGMGAAAAAARMEFNPVNLITKSSMAVEPEILFDVMLDSAPKEKKETLIGALRQLNSDLTVERAAALANDGSEPVLAGIDWSKAETAKRKLQDLGGKAKIRIKMPCAESGACLDGGGVPTGRFVWHNKDFENYALDLDQPPPKSLFKFVVAQSGEEAKEKMKVEVQFEKLLALADLNENKYWLGSTAASVRVPLGPSGARKLQHLILGEGLGHHGLVVGRPGSGKSNLMHVIITTLAISYSPEEMQLYLIDFKKGVEFKPYAEHKLPHALAIAVESEREFGFSVIERLDLELKERGDRFRAAGANNILEYRQKRPNERLPRVLLLIDEFQELFVEDDNLARQSATLLDRLVRQGRAFGLHVILGSQTLGSVHNLPRATLDQMAIRIAMQCTDADSRLILADDNPAARLLSRPGEAIYNASTGTVEGNNLFQVALFQEEDRKKWLNLITQLAERRGGTIPAPIIFEGNELARVEDCRALNELIAAANWPDRAKSADLFLGEPIAIRPSVAARIRRQSGSNLAILTRDESEGTGMCVASLLSLLLQHAPGDARIFIADFTTADSEWAAHAEEIERTFPGEIKVVGRQRDVTTMLSTLADEVRARAESLPQISIYLVLQGMHRIKVLREDEADEDGRNAVELLGTILRDGPEVGVHVIAWADSWANATRGLGRKRFGEFGLRVGTAMNAEESMNFFDGPAASRLSKPHRAVFSDEDRPGQLVTFRPYAMPHAAQLREVGQKLRSRMAGH